MSAPSPETTPTVNSVRDWLVDRVAFYLELSPSDVAMDAPMVDMGLDSVYAMTLSGDIEEHFGLIVEPTVAWDHPTIVALADHLSERLRHG